MQPKWHALWGFVASYILIYSFEIGLLNGAIVFLSSVFIDLDHVTRYIIKTKNFNPTKFWQWSKVETKKFLSLTKKEKLNSKFPFFFLHGIEILMITFLLGLKYSLFGWIFAGFLIHMILDYIEIIKKDIPLGIKFSEIGILIKNNKK